MSALEQARRIYEGVKIATEIDPNVCLEAQGCIEDGLLFDSFVELRFNGAKLRKAPDKLVEGLELLGWSVRTDSVVFDIG